MVEREASLWVICRATIGVRGIGGRPDEADHASTWRPHDCAEAAN